MEGGGGKAPFAPLATPLKMADLPRNRVTPDEPPFTDVGIDYFGTFYVKRGRSQVKRYGCIFTGFAIRAIHIEVAHSPHALQTFISRRGQPKEITSDNGSNFVGGMRELREAIEGWKPLEPPGGQSRLQIHSCGESRQRAAAAAS